MGRLIFAASSRKTSKSSTNDSLLKRRNRLLIQRDTKKLPQEAIPKRKRNERSESTPKNIACRQFIPDVMKIVNEHVAVA